MAKKTPLGEVNLFSIEQVELTKRWHEPKDEEVPIAMWPTRSWQRGGMVYTPGGPWKNLWSTLPEINIAPENRPLEKEIPAMLVARECTVHAESEDEDRIDMSHYQELTNKMT